MQFVESADKAHLIWNMDETGLQLDHRPGKVVAKKKVSIYMEKPVETVKLSRSSQQSMPLRVA